MKTLLLFCLLIFLAGSLIAQTHAADSIQQEAKELIRKGDFDNAVTLLNVAVANNPNDLEILKDLLYANFLKRDFAKAMEIGKQITERQDADVQSFQLLGLTYKAIADYNEGSKLYKKALDKFPSSGVLYSEYGDLLFLEEKPEAAIQLWEKGIERDVNNSSNYYYAAKYYAGKGNILRAALYGETFVNIESLTTRTNEIKELIADNYKKILNKNFLSSVDNTSNDFEKAVRETFSTVVNTDSVNFSLSLFNNMRIRFIEEWYKSNAAQFPYRLFQHHYFLLSQKMFSAYNQWLFDSSPDNSISSQDEMNAFDNYKRNVVYKIPQGQYYK
jgi:tetratricopeptide (TPR) repeat protein